MAETYTGQQHAAATGTAAKPTSTTPAWKQQAVASGTPKK